MIRRKWTSPHASLAAITITRQARIHVLEVLHVDSGSGRCVVGNRMPFLHARHAPIVIATESQLLAVLDAFMIRTPFRLAIDVVKNVLRPPFSLRRHRFFPFPVQMPLPHQARIVVDDNLPIFGHCETHRVARVIGVFAMHECCFPKLTGVGEPETGDRIQRSIVDLFQPGSRRIRYFCTTNRGEHETEYDSDEMYPIHCVSPSPSTTGTTWTSSA